MALSIGIVGLPNVGKSTLFNALSSAKAEAANYPFCTIEPNVGVVVVPDPACTRSTRLVHAEKIVPTAINFVDIAGLVRGASRAKGSATSSSRTSASATRSSRSRAASRTRTSSTSRTGSTPSRDIATVTIELCLKDLDTVNKRLDRARKTAKGNLRSRSSPSRSARRSRSTSTHGKPARTHRSSPTTPTRATVLREMQLLTAKPAFYVANVDEASLANLAANQHYAALEALAKQKGAPWSRCAPRSKRRSPSSTRRTAPSSSRAPGLKEPGLNAVIRAGYELLGLLTFFTAGKVEVRAWTT